MSEISLDDLRAAMRSAQSAKSPGTDVEVWVGPDQEIVLGRPDDPESRRLSQVPPTVFA